MSKNVHTQETHIYFALDIQSFFVQFTKAPKDDTTTDQGVSNPWSKRYIIYKSKLNSH